MGFDLYGVKPKSSAGKYFRNNCWWWRKTWAFTCYVGKGVLTAKDMKSGNFNDHHLINAKKAAKLGILLETAVLNKKALKKLKKALGQNLSGLLIIV